MVQVEESRARGLATAILQRYGLAQEDAAIVADVLLEAELRGRPTHGLVRLPGIVRVCGQVARVKCELVVDRGPCACVDGLHQLGYLACHRAAREAIARAKAHGVALVAVRRTRHMGMLGYYVDLVAREEMVGLAFADCQPLVAPWGGVSKVLGTNPIAAAFPWRPHPIVVDMGTSAITYGDLMMAQRLGGRIPEGAAVDEQGRPTADAAAARQGALLPFGGHKGYALGLMAQLLSGALTLAGGLPVRPEDYGFLILAVRVDVMGSAEGYRAEVGKLVAAIRSSRPMQGFDEIRLPGERAYREREKRQREGIPVDENLWRELCELASAGD
jgi:L-2-hydroxycarboxylate dehydrogenase (NAD+)